MAATPLATVVAAVAASAVMVETAAAALAVAAVAALVLVATVAVTPALVALQQQKQPLPVRVVHCRRAAQQGPIGCSFGSCKAVAVVVRTLLRG